MKISPHRPRTDTLIQPFLFDKPVNSIGEVRRRLGRWAELLTAWVFDCETHPDSTAFDYCPDLSVSFPGGRDYLESKAVGKSGTMFVYKGRLEKDETFADRNSLYYAIWRHRSSPGQAKTIYEMAFNFVNGITGFYLIPFRVIQCECLKRPCEKLNSAYGGSSSRKTYGSGYRIPMTVFRNYQILEF